VSRERDGVCQNQTFIRSVEMCTFEDSSMPSVDDEDCPQWGLLGLIGLLGLLGLVAVQGNNGPEAPSTLNAKYRLGLS